MQINYEYLCYRLLRAEIELGVTSHAKNPVTNKLVLQRICKLSLDYKQVYLQSIV